LAPTKAMNMLKALPLLDLKSPREERFVGADASFCEGVRLGSFAPTGLGIELTAIPRTAPSPSASLRVGLVLGYFLAAPPGPGEWRVGG
jgi:hypothetical protein